MFNINKQTDYALVTIANLRGTKGFIPLSHLIEQTKMPRRFLARITADLVREGILISKEGKTGGYKLAKQPHEITLYDFLQIFEGDLKLVGCADSRHKCSCAESCYHNEFFKSSFSNVIIGQLKKWTLADVFQE